MTRLLTFALALLMTSGIIGCHRATTLMNFDGLDASKGAVEGDTLADYLDRFGIEPGSITPGTKIQVVDARKLGGVNTASPCKVLTQIGSHAPASFTLHFDPPLSKLQFTRPQLTPSAIGVSHPRWRATAFDARGTVLHTAEEPLITSSVAVPAAKFTLWGPGISGVLFESDTQNFAGPSAVLLHEFQLTRPRGEGVQPPPSGQTATWNP